MNTLIKNMKRGFAPLAILLLVGAFLMAGVLTFAPQGDVFAEDPVCGDGVVEGSEECDDGSNKYCDGSWLYGSYLEPCEEDADCEYAIYGDTCVPQSTLPGLTESSTDYCDGTCLVVEPCEPELYINAAWEVTPMPADHPAKSQCDHVNVQHALNSVPSGGTVLLKDDLEFDFGGSAIEITKPDVTLQGETDGVATDLFPAGTPTTQVVNLNGSWCGGVQITAPGVEILSLDLVSSGPILVSPLISQSGNTVKIKGNKLSGATYSSVNNYNCYDSIFMSVASPLEIENNFIDGRHGIHILFSPGKLDIIDNEINATNGDGMWISGWYAGFITDPESGENEKVRIIGNTLNITDVDWGTFGIALGTSESGVNNAIVKDNILTGTTGYGGLIKLPYGHNNLFINNDLSGLNSLGPQIWHAGGRDNKFLNNKLGPVIGTWSIFAPDEFAGELHKYNAAVLSLQANWHDTDGDNTPNPVNEGNLFSSNDYSNTGLPGWGNDPVPNPYYIAECDPDSPDYDEEYDCDGYYTQALKELEGGNVLILDFMQRRTFTGYHPEYGYPLFDYYTEPFSPTNTVSEFNFPEGTDVCDQVMDLTNLNPDEPDLAEGTSHVAGWIACEAHARKAAFDAASEAYKNFSQFLKAREGLEGVE